MFNGSANNGEFDITGTSFSIDGGSTGGDGETIDIGNENMGLLFNKMSYSLGYGLGQGIISEQGISQSPSLSYR